MRIFKYLFLCFVIVVFCLCFMQRGKLQAESKERKPSDKEVLAVIGKEKITLGEFNELIESFPPQYQNIIREDKERFLDDVINRKLLYHEALKRKLDKDKDVKKKIRDMTEQILINEVLIKEVKEKVSVSEEEMKQYYESHKDEFQEPEEVRARHILVDTEEEAKEIADLISKGSDFSTLAKERSKCPSKDRGGDLGFFGRGQMDPEFEKVAFNLKVGEVSGIVKTRFGYHIIKLEEKKPARLKDYSTVKNLIRQRLITRKNEERSNAFIEELRNKSKIIIHKELLK